VSSRDLAAAEVLPDYISATKGQFLALYSAGIIRPLFPTEGYGTVRYVAFANRQLDAVLNQFGDLLIVEESNAGVYHSVAFGCQRGGRSLVFLLR